MERHEFDLNRLVLIIIFLLAYSFPNEEEEENKFMQLTFYSILSNENKQDQVQHLRLFQNDHLLVINQRTISLNDNAK